MDAINSVFKKKKSLLFFFKISCKIPNMMCESNTSLVEAEDEEL